MLILNFEDDIESILIVKFGTVADAWTPMLTFLILNQFWIINFWRIFTQAWSPLLQILQILCTASDSTTPNLILLILSPKPKLIQLSIELIGIFDVGDEIFPKAG